MRNIDMYAKLARRMTGVRLPSRKAYKFPQKGDQRNNKCPCGSGKKFKICCWGVEV